MHRRRLDLRIGLALAAVAAALLLAPVTAHAADAGSSIGDIGAWTFAAAFGWGVLTSLTPCVFPMIGITVAVFGARDEAVTRRRAMMLANSYVLGMAAMYSSLGVVSALAGKHAGSLLGNPWFVLPLAALFIALAASMFGAFDLTLPQSLQQRLSRIGGRGYGGAFALGVVGGVLAAPCVGPFVAAILAVVAKSQNVAVGFSLMFTYALGIGVLFWVLAVFAMRLPKSGAWMDTVKSVCGIALLALAVHFLRPIVPAISRYADARILFLIGAIAAVGVGIALGAAHLSFHGSTAERVRKGAGVALAVAGLTAAVSWLLVPKRPLDWRHDEIAALTEARDTRRGVLIDFSAEWCGPCKELDAITFSDSLVHAEIESRFVPLKIDATHDTPAVAALQTKYAADTMPTVILLDADGREVDRVAGDFVGPDEFLERLRRVEID
jgi:thiol:disulfide interchange protein DsbD